MNQDEFTTLLRAASAAAIRFARDYVSDDLSCDYRYHLLLNKSFDGNATPDEVLYPEDDGVELFNLIESQVVDQLWREQKCPEWIDISVEATNPHYSLLELLCCGRFTADPSKMYYTSRGTGPFGVKSPPLPPRFSEGQRFALPAV